jgi:hypothetical protein
MFKVRADRTVMNIDWPSCNQDTGMQVSQLA